MENQYVRKREDIEEQKVIKGGNLETALPVSNRQPNPQLVPIRPPSLDPESSKTRVSKIMRHANFSTIPPKSSLTKFHTGFHGELSSSYVKLETKNPSNGGNKTSQITTGTVSSIMPPANISTVSTSDIAPMTPMAPPHTTAPTYIKVFPAEKTVKVTNKSKLVKFSPKTTADDDESAVESKVPTKYEIINGDEKTKGTTSKKRKLENESLNEKRFACPICNRRFTRKFNMQTHQLTHEVDRVKPFLCSYPDCEHRFTRKHDLKRHIYGIHELPEHEFKCFNCSRTFTRKDACKRHSLTCHLFEEIPEYEIQERRRRRPTSKTKYAKYDREISFGQQGTRYVVSTNNFVDGLENKIYFFNMSTAITTLDQRALSSNTMKHSTEDLVNSLDFESSSSSTIETVDNLMDEPMPEESIDQMFEGDINGKM
ncbi:11479_t:CDS:1 [Funneliformis geosporum]|uniref:2536_t:CDS:1 n=1 Tax=Funneliformis geosporum TaxID=1117311 RepID=A0A9W4SJ39_9GLOM|nr:2536_t:CDS:1 [Funneliformis geosporum]CAI2171202.1 11479_t:CDS:1 [Funneliformis geosporum]